MAHARVWPGPLDAADAFAVAAPDALRRRSARFVHIALLSCLCLQRFGLSFGGSVLFLSLPVFMGLLAWMLARKQARIGVRSLSGYSLVALSFLVSTLIAITFPDPRVENSMGSLAAILVTYALFTIEPNERFDSSRTVGIFLFYVRVCSLLGIAQYLAQFAGIKIFSFSMTMPFLKPVLVEHQFAFNPLLAYGSTTLRSNGFFFLEPSIFSQVLVIAASLEFFTTRRYRYLPLYGAAYLFSFSGTGILSLAIAVAIYGFTSPRNMLRTAGFAAAGAVALAVAAVAAPTVFESFAERSSELSSSGSSGYARYLAQFDAIKVFIQEARALVGYGPGATERSIYWVNGSGNPALKLFIDYGLFGLALFGAFFLSVLFRAGNVILSVLCLVIFQVGGGNLLFSPFIVLTAVLCVWGRPTQSRPPAHAAGGNSVANGWLGQRVLVPGHQLGGGEA